MRTALLLCCTLAAWETTAAATDRDALIAGNTAFALDLYGRLRAEKKGNIFFSPYSISTAMAMLDAGARGQTAAGIEKAMHLPFGGSRLTSSWSGLSANLKTEGSGVELVNANALWAAKDVDFLPDYLRVTKADFGARLETLDFTQPEPARARINQWVSETTRKKIRELIGAGIIRADTRLVLTNAIYMNGKWQHPFPERGTYDGPFHAPDGDVKTKLMHQVETFRYARVQKLRVLELPYEGGQFSMVIILPDANDGLADVEKSLTAASLSAWESKLKPTLVAVTLPKFTSEMSLMLADQLKSMGAMLAFTDKADFSGIAKEPLMVAHVIHKAHVDVKEKGTEAAAATAVIMMPTSAMPNPNPPKPEIFEADHPFFYVIRRNGSGTILFVGRLVNPASK